MITWEYDWIEYEDFDLNSQERLNEYTKDLDEYGKKGFELVSSVTQNGNLLITFKRPIKEKKQPKTSLINEANLRKFSV